MAYLKEIKTYKDKVLDALWNSQEFKDLMELSNVSFEKFLERVIPVGKNADTITEAGSYVLFEVDPRKTVSAEYMEYTIRFWVIVHDSKNLTPKGAKTDLIPIKLDELFGDSRKFGLGELKNGGAPSFVTSKGFTGRTLTYYTTDFRGVN